MAKKESIKELEHEKEELEAENERLKAKLTQEPKKPTASFWRGLAIALCAALLVATLIIGNVAFWAGNTIVNTNKYIYTVRPILRDTAVQQALADYTTTQLFKQVNVQQTVQNALPPRAAFLAPQLTSQLHGATDKTLQTVLASPRFQTVWVNTNRTAHDKLINGIKHSKGDGVVNLQAVYDSLSQNLKDTKLSFLAGKSLPQNIGSITVVNAPWVPKARFVVNSVSWLKPVSLLLIAVFSATAIWLARRRRTVVIVLAGLASLSMIATLIAIQIVRHAFALQAPPVYQTAANHAAGIILHPLMVQTIAILCVAIIIKITAWVTGPYKLATATRRLVDRWLTAPLHRLIFRGRENSATKWLGSRKAIYEWCIVAIIALNRLLTEISPKMVIASALAILVLVLTVETIAAPHSKR